MAQNRQALKSRIRSTQATMKITSAMELMSNSKLQRQRSMMEKNREYSTTLLKTLHHILSESDQVENKYLLKNDSETVLTIVFSSDLGLCGGYNVNMLRYATTFIKKEDPIIVIGSKGRNWLSTRGYNVVNEYIDSDAFDYVEASNMIEKALQQVLSKEIGKIQVVYTYFKNTVTFEPRLEVLFPVEKGQGKLESKQEILFEPNADEILNTLIPMALKSTLYSLWMETKTSEQASRRLAMENATDNAEELKEKLVLQFNQARQAAITQEITEIVAGADSL
ncbi:MAG: ATP synthase F1 subunit gamma [Erysipelotrichaceae bacterium]|nr:ATP synthase F1 subunit gamma [Erysipelotrichaceae bacterium]